MLLCDDRVPEDPHAGDLDFDDVARLERADARGRAGRDEVAGLERHRLRDVGDEGDDAEGHLARPGPLALPAVHAAHDLELGEAVWVHPDGPPAHASETGQT